jgi:hypothetical protein
MMRVLATLLLLLFAIGTARAGTDPGCPAMKELLRTAADALEAARDGKPANGRYVVDAAVFAADRTIEAKWPEATLDILGEMGLLAIAITERNGEVMPGDAVGMLGYADALAVITAERCGEGFVPVFVRPGAGDPRACTQVIKTLAAIEEAMPAIRGDQPPLMAMLVATAGKRAFDHAAVAQWNTDAVDALRIIEISARAIARGDTPSGPNAERRMRNLAATVTAEAKGICAKYYEAPVPASAGSRP